MSCWVVPSLAAEVWQIPLEQVWQRIRSGELETKEESGFTFVDVAPYGPKVSRPNLPPHQRPATFIPALVEPTHEPEPELTAPEAAAIVPAVASERATDDEDEMGPQDETASEDLGDWRTARRRNARLRVPPLKWRMSA